MVSVKSLKYAVHCMGYGAGDIENMKKLFS